MDKVPNIYDSADKIDAAIKTRLAQFSRKGGKSSTVPKWTEEELELRHAVIWDYITKQGLSREETARQISLRWDITMKTARIYVIDAIKDFASKFTEQDTEQAKKLFLERCETLLQSAFEQNDKNNAIRTLDLMGKATGIFTEKKQVDVSGDMDIHFDFQ